MCSLVLLFTIFLQLVASYVVSKCLQCLLVFTYALFLQKPLQGNKGSGESKFGGSEKNRYLFEGSKMAAKTCYRLRARIVGFLFLT